MPTWEYRTVAASQEMGGVRWNVRHGWQSGGAITQVTDLSPTLAALGEDGWELTSTIGSNDGSFLRFVFKRPVD